MHITQKKRRRLLKSTSPTRIIVSSFALIIFTGACLLSLPIASNDGNSIGFLNALFTATSATCVTGLVIADTLTQWTLFGQIIILLLIQIGGLGIVTFATFFSVFYGMKKAINSFFIHKFFNLVCIWKINFGFGFVFRIIQPCSKTRI